jgi:hypothetical protein
MTNTLTAAGCLPAAWAEWICKEEVERSGRLKISRDANPDRRGPEPPSTATLPKPRNSGAFFSASAKRATSPRAGNVASTRSALRRCLAVIQARDINETPNIDGLTSGDKIIGLPATHVLVQFKSKN